MCGLMFLSFLIFAPNFIIGMSTQNELKSRDGYLSYGGYGGYGTYGNGGNGGNGNGNYAMGNYDDGGLDILSDVLIGALAALAGLALLSTLMNTLGAALAFFVGRKKRDLSEFSPDVQKQLKEMDTLQQFVRTVPTVADVQPQKLMANYLTCTGLIDDKNHCLERLACEFEAPNGNFSFIEKKAMSVIYDTIISNNFIPNAFRNSLQVAVNKGKHKGDCHQYSCSDYLKGLIN